MKILALARDIPATSQMPGSPRFFHFCKELSKKHELVLATFVPSENREQWFLKDEQTKDVFKKRVILPERGSPTWLNKQRHRLSFSSHLFHKYLFPRHFQEVCKTIKELTQVEDIDLIYAEGLQMTQYLFANSNIPRVVDVTDSLTVLFHKMAKQERKFRRKIALSLEGWEVSQWEKKLHTYFPLVIAISDQDGEAIKRLAPDTNLLILPNGVDADYFKYQQGSYSKKLVFTGVMAYGPNEDAALYFAKDIFPLIREGEPEAEFWIVGDAPSKTVMALHGREGVFVTGTVDDVRPYVWDAGVYVSPLRYGAGIKNKILAAFSMGAPVVATSASIEGIHVISEKHLLLADGAKHFANQVLRLLGDTVLQKSLTTAAHSFVEAEYSWSKLGIVLDGELEKVLKLEGKKSSELN